MKIQFSMYFKSIMTSYYFLAKCCWLNSVILDSLKSSSLLRSGKLSLPSVELTGVPEGKTDSYIFWASLKFGSYCLLYVTYLDTIIHNMLFMTLTCVFKEDNLHHSWLCKNFNIDSLFEYIFRSEIFFCFFNDDKLCLVLHFQTSLGRISRSQWRHKNEAENSVFLTSNIIQSSSNYVWLLVLHIWTRSWT